MLAGAELEKAALKEPAEGNFQARALTLRVPIAEQLLEKEKGVSLVGLSCLLAGLTKTVLGTALEVEMTEHFGCEKHQASDSEMPVEEMTEWQSRQLDRVYPVCSSTRSSRLPTCDGGPDGMLASGPLHGCNSLRFRSSRPSVWADNGGRR